MNNGISAGIFKSQGKKLNSLILNKKLLLSERDNRENIRKEKSSLSKEKKDYKFSVYEKSKVNSNKKIENFKNNKNHDKENLKVNLLNYLVLLKSLKANFDKVDENNISNKLEKKSELILKRLENLDEVNFSFNIKNEIPGLIKAIIEGFESLGELKIQVKFI